MGGIFMGIMQDKRRVIEIPLDDIYPNPAQPRRSFPEKELLELSRSIRQNGLLQPLSVRRTRNGYELIAGERRWRACRLAGLDSAACIVNSCSDKQSAVLAMTENLQRQDLQIFEEAEGIRRLIEEWGVTQEEAALRLGKSQSTLANKLRLLRLTQEERKKISENSATTGCKRKRPQRIAASPIDEIVQNADSHISAAGIKFPNQFLQRFVVCKLLIRDGFYFGFLRYFHSNAPFLQAYARPRTNIIRKNKILKSPAAPSSRAMTAHGNRNTVSTSNIRNRMANK